jgi:hypothetical protein
MKYKSIATLAFATTLSLTGSLEAKAQVLDNTKPWTFWYWMYGAVSKPGIHADLVGMKQIGLGGCYLMPIRDSKVRPEYGGQADQLTPTFWEMVDYAFQQADSLKLDMGIHISDGFALAGGPWITPAESMQKVVWTDTIVSVKSLRDLTLRQPESYQGYYEDIAAFAIPVKSLNVTKCYQPKHIQLLGDMSQNEKGTYRASKPASLVYDLGQIETVRSLTILPSGNNVQSQRWVLKASNDGVNYWTVKEINPARQGWQSSGPGFTYAIPATMARYFRFDWTVDGSEPGSEDLDPAKWKPVLKLKDILLSGEAKVNQWEGKSGASWRVAEATTSEELTDADCIALQQVIPLQLKDNQIITKLSTKSKYYRILRFGHTSTGQMNATAGGGKGLEVDKFNEEAVDKQFDHWYKRFLDRPHGSVVKYLHIDSWECGTQNWGRDFAKEFKLRRGYDLIPYLPLYAGIPLESAEKSEKVLKDIRLTINDLVNDVFFERLEERGHIHWRKVTQESIAPTFIADGLEHYKYADNPMGEFWLNSPTHDKPNDMLDAISGAHIYGKNIVQAEGLTEVRGVWDETPAMVKPLIDRHFALGMNKLFFHVNTHNPWMDRKPGMTLDGIGYFFQRDNTWYQESRAMVDYVTRCQQLLQEGTPVVDIAVFTGEEMPSRALTPDRLVPMLPGIFGQNRVASEQVRLANVGEPMEESPVGVNHSAGIIDMKDWVNALHGYHYDSMNKDALLTEAKIEKGCLVMPGGIRYRVLVLPGKTKMDPSFKGYSAEVQTKIDACRRAGIIVIDQPYQQQDFAQYGLPRDVELPEGIGFAHRTSINQEIYFLTNQKNEVRDIEWSYRGGSRSKAHFEPYQSLFFICDKADGKMYCIDPVTGDRELVELNSRTKVRTDIPLTPKTWQIEFLENGKKKVTKQLLDWSKDTDEQVKYYSGTAVYATDFKYNNKITSTQQIYLQLGEVRDIAHVYINDIDCGTAWTAPYQVHIGKALRKGKNTLRIEVVNTWANALNGAEKGKAPYAHIWTNAKYRMKGDQLLPAGLLGPLNILKYE